MTTRLLLRDLTPLAFAATLGWWAHSASTAVHAETAPHNDTPLSFQLGGTGLDGSLSIYNSENHTLYVYPAKSGGSEIQCAYSLHVEKPGGPIERTSCPVGSTVR